MKTASERAAIMFNYKNDFNEFMAVAEHQLNEYAEDRIKELKTRKVVPLKTEEIAEVITILNQVCGTGFKPTSKAAASHINARLTEGFTIPDFMLVINNKHKKWGVDEKMREYLRPVTLFGTKFEAYLQEAKRNLPKKPSIHFDFNGNPIK